LSWSAHTPFLNGVLDREVRETLKNCLIPDEVNSDVVRVYVVRALRNGVWVRLRRECRALLTVLSRYVRLKEFKSEVLKDVVRESLLEIELNTFKGRALYYGFIILKLEFNSLIDSLRNVLSRALYLGVSYLNNPPLFKYLS